MGFGEKVAHSKPKTEDPFYGEWEVGSYSSAWRIVREGRVVCGSSDVVDSIKDLDERLQAITLGSVMLVETLSLLDIRVKLDNGVFIDFICASKEDDEMFHIFGPENLYVEYACPDGWRIGKSNVPWVSAP